jgi:hypothetical protein
MLPEKPPVDWRVVWGQSIDLGPQLWHPYDQTGHPLPRGLWGDPCLYHSSAFHTGFPCWFFFGSGWLLLGSYTLSSMATSDGALDLTEWRPSMFTAPFCWQEFEDVGSIFIVTLCFTKRKKKASIFFALYLCPHFNTLHTGVFCSSLFSGPLLPIWSPKAVTVLTPKATDLCAVSFPSLPHLPGDSSCLSNELTLLE